MSLESTSIHYHGWSSFAVETANGKLLFDPMYRKIFGAQWCGLEDFKDANVICLTHGHYDHYVDAPKILEKTDAVAVASPDICRHLSSKYGIKKEKLVPIEPFQEIQISDFTITAFEWGHREVSIPKFIKEGLLRAEFLPTLQFAWLNLFKVPFNVPYYGFHVKLPGQVGIMNYCEGFSDHMNIETVTELADRFKTDILLAGMQLDFEDHLSRGAAALSPKSVVLFHPHQVLFERLGLKSSPPETFVEKLKQALPDVNACIATPRSSFEASAMI
jgi:beta-lactamase family protein